MPSLEDSTLADSGVSGVSAPGLASEEDAAILAKLGYKQELRRNFTMIEIFGISFSIMGLLPSIASVLVYSIPAGPVGMVWGWFLASGFIFVVGLAMVFDETSSFAGQKGSCAAGRSRFSYAYFWWLVLVDTFLRIANHSESFELPCWVQ
ncbi:MAG: hypothetical protein Q9185_006514 [Variospora sp. 1 TL-2023]